MVKEYGYEYDAALHSLLWKETKGRIATDRLFGAICLRSGRDALKAIAREYEPTDVFLPALACDSMVLPFRMYGHTIRYYRLNSDYTIDLDWLDGQLTENALFLFMNYFGIQAIQDCQLTRIKQTHPKLVFIEDRTHHLIWKSARTFKPDYTVASLLKWLNVPDGGLLWDFTTLRNSTFSEDMSFSETRLKAQCMRATYLQTGNEETKTKYREIFSTVSDIIDSDLNPARMSAYAYALAANTDWNIIRTRRKENASCLISILQEAGVPLIQEHAGISDLYVAFLTDHRDSKQNDLSSKGIFNTIIWPLADEQKQTCRVAQYTQACMLAAPCDQRYTTDDMAYIGKEIVQIIGKYRYE